MLDKKRVITEVATKNGIRVGPDDPFFAGVTMMQLGLEESLRDVVDRFKAIITEFESHVRVVERRAGKVLAQEVKECAAEMRRGLQGDISAAGLKARELVQSVHESHERPNVIFWTSIGLLCALALFFSGVWFGKLTAAR
jgi:hypothetical protein